MSTLRIGLVLACLVGLLGCLWLLDDRAYQRGWSARDEEVRTQNEVTASIDLDTLIRNTAETREADRRVIDELKESLTQQKGIEARLRANFKTQPKDEHAPQANFAQCRVDDDTRGLLNEAIGAANASIDASDADRVGTSGPEAAQPAH